MSDRAEALDLLDGLRAVGVAVTRAGDDLRVVGADPDRDRAALVRLRELKPAALEALAEHDYAPRGLPFNDGDGHPLHAPPFGNPQIRAVGPLYTDGRLTWRWALSLDWPPPSSRRIVWPWGEDVPEHLDWHRNRGR